MIMHCKCSAILSKSYADKACVCDATLPSGWRVCVSCQTGNHDFNVDDHLQQYEDCEPIAHTGFAQLIVSLEDAQLLMTLLDINGYGHSYLGRKVEAAEYRARQVREEMGLTNQRNEV